MTATRISPHEAAARARKIARLMAALWKHRVPAERAWSLTTPEWQMVAEVAGCTPPSEATVSDLLQVLQEVKGAR